MSWDATLSYGGMGQDWNYTHNCNGMIETVLDLLQPDWVEESTEPFWVRLGAKGMGRASWWDVLDGLNGEEGFKVLSQIVGGLSEAPEFFREMNPDNGWGDYDSLMRVLIEMRDASEAAPAATWRVSG